MSQLLKEIQAAEEELLVGNVILYPTDTVWGIGCDAENANAIKRLFKVKERDEAKSMIILVPDVEMLSHYVNEVPDGFENMHREQNRPTTYVFPGAKNLPKELIAADGTIAIRITTEEFSHRLARQVGRPIVSTSANISGEPAPTSFADIAETIKERVDHVVNWRQDEEMEAKPSRIIKLNANGEQQVIRE